MWSHLKGQLGQGGGGGEDTPQHPNLSLASPTHPHTSAGRIYGHVGIYVGNGTVMDNVGFIRSIGVDEWIAYYGVTVTPRWGWIGGWVLG